MRNKKAKALRKQAQLKTVGFPEKEYSTPNGKVYAFIGKHRPVILDRFFAQERFINSLKRCLVMKLIKFAQLYRMYRRAPGIHFGVIDAVSLAIKAVK